MDNNDDSVLAPPYGGAMVDLLVSRGEKDEMIDYANQLPSLQLSARSICDLELLATGAFSPLDRFMGEDNYHSVMNHMRLDSGHIFPIPVTLPVEYGADISIGKEITLRSEKNDLLAVMAVEEVYKWDRGEVSQKVFGTTDRPITEIQIDTFVCKELRTPIRILGVMTRNHLLGTLMMLRYQSVPL